MALKPSAYQEYIAKQYENAPVVGAYADNFANSVLGDAAALNFSQSASTNNSIVGGGGTADGKVSAGANPAKNLDTNFIISNRKKDLRVRIKVPTSYQHSDTNAGKAQRGIIFPYTPQISIEYKAEYSSQNPLHSNYTFNFYKNSSISDIGIQGVFTVQNDRDALALLSTIHLLRALTKGRFGFSDELRGAPPPICRLLAYGDYMLDNVPVSIASFRHDLPTDVDYYPLSKNAQDNVFGEALVPIKSTIIVNCKIMYSREEMLSATVPKWFGGETRKRGLL